MKNFQQYLEEAGNTRRLGRIAMRVAKGKPLMAGQSQRILQKASADPRLGANNTVARGLDLKRAQQQLGFTPHRARDESGAVDKSGVAIVPFNMSIVPDIDYIPINAFPVRTKNGLNTGRVQRRSVSNRIKRQAALDMIHKKMPDYERGMPGTSTAKSGAQQPPESSDRIFQLRSEVNTDPHILSGLMGISQERYTPGIARRVITALGGAPISPKNAKKVKDANREGEYKTYAEKLRARLFKKLAARAQ